MTTFREHLSGQTQEPAVGGVDPNASALQDRIKSIAQTPLAEDRGGAGVERNPLMDPEKKYRQKENGLHYEIRGEEGSEEFSLGQAYGVSKTTRPKEILSPVSVEAKDRSDKAELIVSKSDKLGKGLKTALASVFVADPDERAEIIKGSDMTHEEVDGLHFLIDNKTGKEYVVNKEGFDRQDIYDVLSDVALFAPAGKAVAAIKGTLGKLAGGLATGAGTQAAIETGQYALTKEGEWNMGDVVVASIGGLVGGALDSALSALLKSSAYSQFSNRFLKDQFISSRQKEALELAIKEGDLDEKSIKSLISESENLLAIAKKEGLPDPDINDVLSSLRSKGQPVRYLERTIERGIEEGDSVRNTAFRESYGERSSSALDKLEGTVGSTPPESRAASPTTIGKESSGLISDLKGTRAAEASSGYGGMIAKIDGRVPDKKGVLVKGLRKTLNEELDDIPKGSDRGRAISFVLKKIEQDGDTISAETAHDALKTIRDVLRERTGKNSRSIRQAKLKSIAKDLETRLNNLSRSDKYPDGMLKATDDSYRIASEIINKEESGLVGSFVDADGGVKLDALSKAVFNADGSIGKSAAVDFMTKMAKRNKYAARAFFENHYSSVIRKAREGGKDIEGIRKSIFGDNKKHLLDMADTIDPSMKESLNSLDHFLKGLSGTEKLATKVVDKSLDLAVDSRTGKDKNALFLSGIVNRFFRQQPKSHRNIDRVFAMVLDPKFTSKIKPLLNEGRLRVARLNKAQAQKDASTMYDDGLFNLWLKKMDSLSKSYDKSREAEGMLVSYGQSLGREEVEEGFPKTKAIASDVKRIITKNK